ncbi:MAG: O-methyltransferase [Deltaproteobacteria bacterium]|nr:O-methyltransferase [Deltaproteobacteria bacterium]
MTMIADPEQYFRNFIPPRDEILRELEQEAKDERIPIVGPVVGELLFILARAVRAQRILELGTAIGYSAIYLAHGCEPAKGRVITLEWDEGMAARARSNIAKAGLSHLVEVQVGDAQKLMADMTGGTFDLVFLDIDKEGYLPALAHCHRLLKTGGLLIADNVGFAGADPFNQGIMADRRWRAVSLLCFLPNHSPEKDGLAFAVKVA